MPRTLYIQDKLILQMSLICCLASEDIKQSERKKAQNRLRDRIESCAEMPRIVLECWKLARTVQFENVALYVQFANVALYVQFENVALYVQFENVAL